MTQRRRLPQEGAFKKPYARARSNGPLNTCAEKYDYLVVVLSDAPNAGPVPLSVDKTSLNLCGHC